MKKCSLWLLINCLGFCFYSCGEESGGGETITIPSSGGETDMTHITPTPTEIVAPNETVATDQQDLDQLRVSLGLSGGAMVMGINDELTSVLTEVLAFASASAGGTQLVTTGTITQDGQSFTYQAFPNDRLKLQLTGQSPLDFFVTQINGDLSSFNRFFDNNHVLEFRVESEQFNLSFGSQRTGGVLGKLVNGFMLLNGFRFEIQVGSEERVDMSAEFDSAQHKSIRQVLGTITADQYQVDLNEIYKYSFILVDNAVENVTHTAENRWTDRGQTYSLSDAMIRYSTFNGWPSEFDYWIAQGSLIRDGQLIGQIGMERKALWIEFYFQFANGGRLEIQRQILHRDDQR